MGISLLFLGVVIAMTVGTLMLAIRTKTKSSVVMATGVVLVWLGVTISGLGPQTVTQSYSPPRDDGFLGLYTETREPATPIGEYMMFGGIVLFGVGFATYGLMAARKGTE